MQWIFSIIKLNGNYVVINRTVTNGKVDVNVDTSTLRNRNYYLELGSGANIYYNCVCANTELPKYNLWLIFPKFFF